MGKTALLTDSACDLLPEEASRLGITTLHFSIEVDGKKYTEGVDFTPDEYYAMLDTCQGLPHTTQVDAVRCLLRYRRLAAAGFDSVIYVTISSTGSASYNSACMAKEAYERRYMEKYPLQIFVVDSRTYSLGYGEPLCRAAEMLKEGQPARTVVDFLARRFAGTEILLGMYTLRFAKKSGRISAAAAFAGEMLGLKPVVLMKDGATTTVDKVRGDKNLLPAMVRHMIERMAPGTPYSIGYTKAGPMEEAVALCTEALGYGPTMVGQLGAAVASNAGPDGIGLIYTAAQAAARGAD